MNITDERKYIIRVYFETWNEESLEIGETNNKGMKEEIIYTNKDFEFFDTIEEFLDKVCEKISSYGTFEGCNSIYYTCDSVINFRTGERTNYSVFLEGFDYFTEVTYIEKKLKIT